MGIHFSLVPQDKHDLETAEAAVAAGYPAVEAVLPRLLEWLQDMNWPVAGVLAPFLASIGEPLIPHIRKVFETDDEIWKYWIMSEFLTVRTRNRKRSAKWSATWRWIDRPRVSAALWITVSNCAIATNISTSDARCTGNAASGRSLGAKIGLALVIGRTGSQQRQQPGGRLRGSRRNDRRNNRQCNH